MFDSHHYSEMWIAYCTHCRKISYWLQGRDPSPVARVTGLGDRKQRPGPSGPGRMVHPAGATAPFPHSDMPDCVRADYEEAREIASNSPRAAAALLRLAVQKLCKELGESGKNITDDIANLVKQGLSVEIQQALDIVRVVGNNAVHPGEMQPDDVADVAFSLFELINQIVEERISKPKKLHELFERLPARAREAIRKRDGQAEKPGLADAQ